MDVDKVALAGAAFVATVVFLLCMFYSKVEGFETAIRIGVAFVVSYGVTFVSFQFVQRTARDEISVQEEARATVEAARRAVEEAEKSDREIPGEME
jgi:hypothetical protein